MAPTPMTATRLVLLESLFDTALSLSGELRESFVQESTSHDPALAADLRALLSAHALGDSVFASPVSADRDLSQRWIGARLGAYEVGAQVGAGGMGTVHEAVRADDEYRQRVAVKFLTRGAEGGAAVRRFRAERQFLASLQHPNVATLIDGGVTPDGLPYFVMEYIDGAPITRWCDARSADVKTRLRLFGQVCAAVRAAHQKLIVHRDLKPGNILVTEDGTVKLLDFGIAKLMRDAQMQSQLPDTQIGQRAFTPEYAAPEQLKGDVVDTTADVYALGVILFELLTGQRPFNLQGKSLVEMERLVGEQPAPRPSSVLTPERWQLIGERSGVRARKRLEGDIDAVVLMALRKEPSRRYATVDALARDVMQVLDNQPVQARPDSLRYRVTTFVRRRRLETAAGAVALLALIGGAVSTSLQARRAEAARVVAEAQGTRAAEVTRFLSTMLNSSNPESMGKDVTMRTVLDSAVQRADSMQLSPELESEIRGIMGGAYLALGELDLAERQYQLNLAAHRQLAPQGDFGTGVAFANLALIAETRGELSVADSLLQLAEEVYRSFPPTDRREESTIIENRGRLLYQLGKVPESLVEFRKSLALSARYFATDDTANAPTYINAAVLFADAGQLAAADTLSLRGIAAATRAYGESSPIVANALSVRAAVLENLGRLEESSEVYRTTLAMKRRLLGPAHGSWATTAVNYAELLCRMERWREAAELSREVLASRGTSLDDTSYPVQAGLLFLGRALAHLDSAKAGERHVREVGVLRRRSLPPDHWLLAAVDGVLGEVLTQAGQFTEAERLLLSAETRIRAVRGETSGPVADQRKRLVALYRKWGRPADVATWQARLGQKGA